MLRATLVLTLSTIAGLVLGFAREWLLVAAWGAGSRTDAFLVALFLPEALRMTLAAGLLSAALLPLYRQAAQRAQRDWLAGQAWHLLLVGGGLALLVGLGAPWWVRLIGPGLAAAARADAAAVLALLAPGLPLLLLHALGAVVGQARERFLLAGAGSFVYNLPAVVLLWWRGAAVGERELALAFDAGALLMALTMLPLLVAGGWRPWRWCWDAAGNRALHARLGPLLASAGASQGLVLLERIVASWLGEGAITVVNLARKLVNLPLVALMSLNQVVLSRLSALADDPAARQAALRVALLLTTALTVPAAAGMIGAAPTLVAWGLPAGMADGPLPWLLAWFAVVIVFGGWNALLARHAYATGDTVTPLRGELAGSAANALALLALPWTGLGMAGIALAALCGCLVTAWALLRSYRMLGEPLVRQLPPLAIAALLAAAGWLYRLPAGGGQFALAAVHSLVWLGVLALWTRQQARRAHSSA